MKNLIIVNTYINTPEKEEILYQCLYHLKRAGYDILVTSNSVQVTERIMKLCTYYIYNDDNFLLPSEVSPSVWFADNEDYIEVHGRGITYAIVKKLALAVDIAHVMKYDNFVFLEYDNVIVEEDIPQIHKMFSILENKLAVFFRFSQDDVPISGENPLGFETMIFGGNVSFFKNRVELPVTYEDWLYSSIYTIGYHALEFKFPMLFKDHMDRVELMMDKKSGQFFPHSKLDLSSFTKNIHIIENTDQPERPVFLVVGNNFPVTIKIDDTVVFNETLQKGEWKKLYFDITNPVVVEISNNNGLDTYNISQESISLYSSGIRRNVK